MKMAIAGAGYVGLANAILLGPNNDGIKVIVYEPDLAEHEFFDSKVVNDLNLFKQKADVIVANCFTGDIRDVADKIYSRDIFSKD